MLFRIQNIDLPRRPFFVIPVNSTLTVDFMSTLFQAQSSLLGSYSYPLDLQLRPNQAFIQNAQIIATDTAKRTINVILWIGAVPFKQCKFRFTINNDVIRGELYIDLSLMANLLKNIRLNQLADPNIDDQYNPEDIGAFKTYITMLASAAPMQYPYVFFPFRNDGAYIADAYVLNPLWKAGVVYGVGTKVTYLNRIYNCVAVTLAGQDPVSWATTQMVNVPQKWEDITVYPDVAIPVSDTINRWEIADDGSTGFIVDPPGGPYRQTYMAFFYLPYVIGRICAWLGYTLESQTLKTDDFKRIVVGTNVPIDASGQIPDYYTLMPDTLVSDFFTELRNQFGLLTDFDAFRNVCTVENLDYLENRSQVVDMQDEQTINYEELSTQTQAITIEQLSDSNDKAFSDGDNNHPLQLIIGDPNKAIQITSIQLASAATKMILGRTPNPVFENPTDNPGMVVTNQRIPWIKMPVAGATPLDQVSSLQYADRYGFKLRFLFYHGMQPDDGGFNYPYGSSDNLDINGNTLRPFNLSLAPGSGDFQSLQRYYTYVANSRPAQVQFVLHRSLFMRLRNNCRVVIRDRNLNSVQCLISQVSADFSNSRDKVAATLTLYPKILPNNAQQVLPPTPAYVPPPPFDNGVVYVRMDLTNGGDFISPIPPHYVTHQYQVTFSFFADAGAATPKDVVNLDVRWQSSEYHNTLLVTSGTSKTTVTSTAFTFDLGIFPADLTEGPNEWLWLYQLMPDAHYTIIP